MPHDPEDTRTIVPGVGRTVKREAERPNHNSQGDDPLPEVVGRDCAFLDRIHGFLPGWTAPQISESRLARAVGFMADYLSEIMHQMRSRNYSPILLDHVDFNWMGNPATVRQDLRDHAAGVPGTGAPGPDVRHEGRRA